MTVIPDGFLIKVKNLKCFGDTPQGFDELRPINVIIGRNNSGKSALLDLISICVNDNFEVPRHLWHGGSQFVNPDEIYLANFPFGGSAGMKLRPVLLLTGPVGGVPEVLVAYVSSVMPSPLLPQDLVLDPATARVES